MSKTNTQMKVMVDETITTLQKNSIARLTSSIKDGTNDKSNHIITNNSKLIEALSKLSFNRCPGCMSADERILFKNYYNTFQNMCTCHLNEDMLSALHYISDVAVQVMNATRCCSESKEEEQENV